jgi:hypothetical protein
MMTPTTRYRHSSNLITMWNLSFTQVSALSDHSILHLFSTAYCPFCAYDLFQVHITPLLLVASYEDILNERADRSHAPTASNPSKAYNFAGVGGVVLVEHSSPEPTSSLLWLWLFGC